MTIYESNFGRRVELRTKSGPGRLLVHRDPVLEIDNVRFFCYSQLIMMPRARASSSSGGIKYPKELVRELAPFMHIHIRKVRGTYVQTNRMPKHQFP